MSDKLPVLFCVGTNHESAGLDFRETLYLERDEIDASLPKVMEVHGIREVMVLSTCNRLEVYGVLDRSEVDSKHLIDLFVDLQRFSPNPKKELEIEIKNHCYQFLNMDAAQHAFSVASGLDSLVLGETQITGQFKDATNAAQAKGTLGPILKRLTQESFSSSKKVRSKTDISKRPVSISHAAIDLANRVYGHIKDYHVLIIGAGEMAEVAAKYAIKYKPKSLSVVNRTLKNAERLVNELGFGNAYGWEDLHEILPTCDIVISSTAAHDFILTKEHVERSQQIRDGRSTFMVDIALPRDLDPKCSDLDDVYLFDIDDLKQVVGENFEERRKAAEKGKTIIQENAENFLVWMGSQKLKPALAGFRNYMDTLFEQEKNKSLSKGPLQSLSDEQRQSIDMLLKSIANKMSGDASRNVRHPPEGVYAEDLAESLLTLFPLSKDKDKS
ncbi:glutamyl-tRNA reductase [Pseudobacteriovorax antillogorgiicola]|uniref:Glutamyl-tRNA reductase n=1 Tax=Pseudobacteriovorax antillogorgiicola TaxID=1513793 RepID=A0A1Y6B778_9BACT|nr:glutamyl-tRNA reductase [Pseudobacteriovorax antillogorgiicola]TCS58826.1 glutamyl-tRNA reductase [Pseudobacteriovorax antillogorgiicola]SME94230.1 glutamyl-tRNA reductase [Pseudobacteriovorax antillogorgiicola]